MQHSQREQRPFICKAHSMYTQLDFYLVAIAIELATAVKDLQFPAVHRWGSLCLGLVDNGLLDLPTMLN